MTSLSPILNERLPRIGSPITPVARIVQGSSQSSITKSSFSQCGERQCPSYFTDLRPLSQSSSSLSSQTHQWLSRNRSARQGVPYPACRCIPAPCEEAAWGPWAAKAVERQAPGKVMAKGNRRRIMGASCISFVFRMEGRGVGFLALDGILRLEG